MPIGMSLVLFYILVTLPALGGRTLAVRVFGFGDREGWALGRTLGLVVVAFPAWWAGVLGIAAWRWVGVGLLVTCGFIGAIDLWRNRPDWRSLAAAETVFVVAAAATMWLRLARPEILNQEKLMDLGILASLLRADGFPPPDMWLAGETLPYYYWGAVIWNAPLFLSKIPLDLAYNFIVAAVGGLTACLLWALGRRAADWRGAGWLAVFFGLFAGTADGFRQIVAGRSIANLDYWYSSRQVPDTITEWPLFTLWLGDLHPHLLSIPLALAAVLLAWQVGRLGPRPSLVGGTAVLFGLTWAANPWAMPPTLVAAALMILCGDGRWHWPDREGWTRWLATIVVAVGGWLAAAPFHLSFHPPFQGIKTVTAWTHPVTLLLWGGVLLIPVAAAAWVLLRRLLGEDGDRRAVAVAVAVVATTLVIASQTERPTLVMLGAMLAVLVIASVRGPSSPARPAIALAALGVFLLAVPGVVYVVDSYGDKLHRMNTVFKCYIQAWVFLAVAMPALLTVGFRSRRTRAAAVIFIGLMALPHLVGMAVQPLLGRAAGIDGLAWMDPGDRAIVRFLRAQPRGMSIVEAAGGAYTEYARISSATGLPSVLGWANHELVWRGHGVSKLTDERLRLIDRIYRGNDPAAVAAAVEESGADFVVIGALERRDFDPAALETVRAAGDVIALEAGGEVVRFLGAESSGN
jgi:YYY domain-containing protein